MLLDLVLLCDVEVLISERFALREIYIQAQPWSGSFQTDTNPLHVQMCP